MPYVNVGVSRHWLAPGLVPATDKECKTRDMLGALPGCLAEAFGAIDGRTVKPGDIVVDPYPTHPQAQNLPDWWICLDLVETEGTPQQRRQRRLEFRLFIYAMVRELLEKGGPRPSFGIKCTPTGETSGMIVDETDERTSDWGRPQPRQ
jgi:hypothetical protein